MIKDGEKPLARVYLPLDVPEELANQYDIIGYRPVKRGELFLSKVVNGIGYEVLEAYQVSCQAWPVVVKKYDIKRDWPEGVKTRYIFRQDENCTYVSDGRVWGLKVNSVQFEKGSRFAILKKETAELLGFNFSKLPIGELLENPFLGE